MPLRSRAVELILREGISDVRELSERLDVPPERLRRALRGVPGLSVDGERVGSEVRLRGYVEVRGARPILLTAPHAQGPGADVFTGEIAWWVARIAGCHALIATVSRRSRLPGEDRPADYNREWTRDTPFRRRISELIEEHGIRFIVDLHGMESDPIRPEVDVGALGGEAARGELVAKVVERLEECGFDVGFEQEFCGGDILEYHCDGKRVQGLQLELSEELREIDEYRGILAVLVVVNTLLGEL